jgi:hypothetical protein
MGDALHEVVSDQFRVTFMLGADDEVSSVENVDAMVTLLDGTRWSATFMSLREIQRIMDRWRSTGECDGGAYFQCYDLVIIRDAGIPAMMRTLEHALSTGGPHTLLTRLDDSTDDDIRDVLFGENDGEGAATDG